MNQRAPIPQALSASIKKAESAGLTWIIHGGETGQLCSVKLARTCSPDWVAEVESNSPEHAFLLALEQAGAA